MNHIYEAWKVDAQCNSIPGTERKIEGKSKRWVLEFLATEEKVPHNHNSMTVRLKDGTFWCVTQIS
jgi:hypothetical protein